jgi:hypothetical protein
LVGSRFYLDTVFIEVPISHDRIGFCNFLRYCDTDSRSFVPSGSLLYKHLKSDYQQLEIMHTVSHLHSSLYFSNRSLSLSLSLSLMHACTCFQLDVYQVLIQVLNNLQQKHYKSRWVDENARLLSTSLSSKTLDLQISHACATNQIVCNFQQR